MQKDHSKIVEILRERCIQLTDKIVSCMSLQVLSKIAYYGVTPEEVAVLYIYKQFINKSDDQYLPDHVGLTVGRLIFNDDHTEIVDVEFKE